MNISVEFHGVLRQLAGSAEASLQIGAPACVGDVYGLLAQRYPDLAARLPQTACAIGDSLVRHEAPLNDGCRLSLIPPVSGG
jgi:molybdopterin converting factor small subunit